MGKILVIRVTFPNKTIAQNFCQKALQKKMVACAQVYEEVDSFYWWKNKIEKTREAVVLLKTLVCLKMRVRDFILQHHPYECPSILSYFFESLNASYLAWIEDSVNEGS